MYMVHKGFEYQVSQALLFAQRFQMVLVLLEHLSFLEFRVVLRSLYGQTVQEILGDLNLQDCLFLL